MRLEGGTPRVFAAAPGRGFARALAEGVMRRLGPDPDPMEMARIVIYAPTRRGARTMTDAFVRLAGGGPILAPRILTLADLDDPFGLTEDLPPPMPRARRLLWLTRLVHEAARASEGRVFRDVTAVALAADLAALLDQAQGERLGLEGLRELAPEGQAEHWGRTLEFLEIVRDAWPAILEEEGACDPVWRRARLIDRQIATWKHSPPDHPVIVAGSTGSVRLSAELIAAVAHLPLGAVVLPGLDRGLDRETFAKVRDDHPDHPQAGLSRLLKVIGGADGPVARDAVLPWDEGEAGPRQAFLSLAMRPAPVTDQWLTKKAEIERLAPDGLRRVTLIEAETPRDEAQAVAFAIREAVHEPERTVALVTSDRTLARQVAAGVARWGIEPDDSAGIPLHLTPPGVFLTLLMDEGLRAPGPGDPVRSLALLKHPIACAGGDRRRHLRLVRVIERTAIRETHCGADIPQIREAMRDVLARRAANDLPVPWWADEIEPWLDALTDGLAPLRDLREAEPGLARIVEALRESAERLSRQDGEPEVWRQAAGEAALGFVESLAREGGAFGQLPAGDAPPLLLGLMAREAVRAPYGQHPRVFIWGPLEARMQCADTMILASLNEESWPRVPDPDPWMSRAMRQAFGLPAVEQRIGLSAHDFQQAMGAERVILSRSRKSGGAPTVASRWLQRIVTLLGEEGSEGGFAPDVLDGMRNRGRRYLRMAAWLAGEAEGEPCARPEPCPPVAARPRTIRATEVQTLIRDPYAVYARRVLGLRALGDVAPEPDARLRGEVLHEIAERVVRGLQPGWTMEDALGAWREATEAVLDAHLTGWPVVRALWRSRAEAVGPWLLEREAALRDAGQVPLAFEVPASRTLEVPGLGPVTLSARADRIDRRRDGHGVVTDYKTGALPSDRQVVAFDKQMPLQGAMLADGDFERVPAMPCGDLAYVQLKGGAEGGSERMVKDGPEMAREAIPRLIELLGAYADPAMPYRPRTRPQLLTYEGDYDHLARVGEWGGPAGAGGEP